jgi:hypothetical protein
VIVVTAVFFLRNRGKQPPRPVDAAATPESAPSPAPAHPAQPALPPAAVPPPSASAPSANTAVATSVTLEIHPIADCWVSLTVDGRKLFARVMKPGERESHTVEHEAIVEVGNAGAFAYSVDGHAGKPIGDVGQVKTLKLTPETAGQYVR